MKRIDFGLFGAGGFGREVMPFVKYSVAKTLAIPETEVNIYFVETGQPSSRLINGHQLISLDDFLGLKNEKYFNIAIGDGRVRAAIVNQIGPAAQSLTLQAMQAAVDNTNDIAAGAVLCPNTIVTANVKIGKFFHCNIFSYVAHDCVIGDYVTFAPSVHCNGRVHIEDYAYIGTNAILRQGTSEKPLRIGKAAVVGMGAVVTKDVPDGATVIGNPARIMDKR